MRFAYKKDPTILRWDYAYFEIIKFTSASKSSKINKYKGDKYMFEIFCPFYTGVLVSILDGKLTVRQTVGHETTLNRAETLKDYIEHDTEKYLNLIKSEYIINKFAL